MAVPRKSNDPIRVLVADSQALFSDAMAIALGLEPDLEILPEHPISAQEAIDITALMRPDVALLDYWLTGMDGPAFTGIIMRQVADQKVILLSWFFSPGHIREAMQAGAAGFIPKSLKVRQVADAVRLAHAGETPVFPEELSQLLSTVDRRFEENIELRKRLESLTPRELEILAVLSHGHPLKEVAEQLFVTHGTLKVHIHSMLKKTGARNQQELLAMARYCGLIV